MYHHRCGQLNQMLCQSSQKVRQNIHKKHGVQHEHVPRRSDILSLLQEGVSQVHDQDYATFY